MSLRVRTRGARVTTVNLNGLGTGDRERVLDPGSRLWGRRPTRLTDGVAAGGK